MTLLEKMESTASFTDTELSVIEYIVKNKALIMNMSIGELSKQTYSSNATIIRVCHKLGFDGYKDFKIAFIKELESKKYVAHSIDYSQPFQIQEDTDSIVHGIYSLYRESLNLIQSQLDMDSIEKIVSCLMQSQRIFVYGNGDAKITAMSFINKMIKINIFPVLATENNEEQHITHSITKQDCALFITYRADNSVYQDCMNILMAKGVQTIVLTANEEGLLAKKSTYSLCLPDRENDDKIATFYSQFGFLYILSIIYSLIYNCYQIEQRNQ